MGTDEDWENLVFDTEEKKLLVEKTHSPGMYQWAPSSSHYVAVEEYLKADPASRDKVIKLLKEYIAKQSSHKDEVVKLLAVVFGQADAPKN